MKIGVVKTVRKEDLMELDGQGLVSLISSHVAKDAGNQIATIGIKQGFLTTHDTWGDLTVRFEGVLLSVPEHAELVRKAMAYEEYVSTVQTVNLKIYGGEDNDES